MISTVTIKRHTTAQVAVEHPDEWDDAQVNEAVSNRAIDVAGRASIWSGEDRTTIARVECGVDVREIEDEDEDDKPYRPDPLELTEDDLGGQPAVETDDDAVEE